MNGKKPKLVRLNNKQGGATMRSRFCHWDALFYPAQYYFFPHNQMTPKTDADIVKIWKGMIKQMGKDMEIK